MIDKLTVAVLFRSAFFAIIVTAIFCFVKSTFILPFTKSNRWDKAGKLGHCATAKLKDASYQINGSHTSSRVPAWSATYLYSYNGREFKYRCITRRYPEGELMLRFEKDPSKAKQFQDFGGVGSAWIRYFLIVFAVIVAIHLFT